MPPALRLLLVLLVFARPALGAERGPHLPPPPPRDLPGALARAPVDERRPVELVAHGRAWVPVAPSAAAPRDSAALGAALGVGFRTSPYFSVGGEASTLRAPAARGAQRTSLELAAVGRVYLLEAGPVDPYLELGLGYEAGSEHRAGVLRHGPSARAGGGLDVVVLSALRLGVLVSYREVVSFPAATCTLGCRVEVCGGVLVGVAVTLPLGQPL